MIEIRKTETFAKEASKNKLYGLRRNFVCFSRRVKARITSYVSLDATQKTSKRTSKMCKLFLLDD
jgi:hypothetical protein